jgi:hypothetical protein
MHVRSQADTISQLLFGDRSNFEITARFGNQRFATVHVLRTTDKWESCRFFLKDDVTSDSVMQAIGSDEHHHYNNCFIFKDPKLNTLFTASDKEHLYRCALALKPRRLVKRPDTYRLIKSYKTAKPGYFYSLTDPIFSLDKQFAFIELVSYFKPRKHEKAEGYNQYNTTYFARTFLIFQNTREKGWTRVEKIDYLIL